MSEKDEFLREIDELLGDSDEETPAPDPAPNHSNTNGVSKDKGVGETNVELVDSLSGLTVDSNNQELPPKTG